MPIGSPTRFNIASSVLLLGLHPSSCCQDLETTNTPAIPNRFERVRQKVEGIYYPSHYPNTHEGSLPHSLFIFLPFLLPPKLETAIAA